MEDSQILTPSLDTNMGSQLSQLNEQLARIDKEHNNFKEREFVRNDSQFDPETALAIYNETQRVSLLMQQESSVHVTSCLAEVNRRVQSKVSGGIVVSPRKAPVIQLDGARVMKSRLSSLNKNVYRQLRNNASPNTKTLANSKFSRGKSKPLGKSTDRLQTNDSHKHQEVLNLQRASRASKMDSSKLNQDIVVSTGNSFHHTSP